MSESVPTETSALLDSRLRAVHARGRLAETLLGIALDTLEPYALDYLSPRDYRRLCQIVEGPVRIAMDAAEAALARELVEAIATADPAFIERLEVLRRRTAVAAE